MHTEVQVISELDLLYKRLSKAQVSVIIKHLKKCAPPILECFVCDQLINGSKPLLENALPGREALHIRIRCWKKDRIGTKDLRAFLGAGEGRPYHFGVFVATSGFTRQAIRFAAKASKPLYLYDLDHLIMIYLSKKTPRIRSPRHDMQFLP